MEKIFEIENLIKNNTAIYQSDAWLFVNYFIHLVPRTISSVELLKWIKGNYENYTNKIILQDAHTFNKAINNFILKDVAISDTPNFGYHLCKIQKGELGKVSKIREELEELEDAVLQDDKILQLCELSDLIGAIEAMAQNLGVTLEDLQKFSEKTKAAFKGGKR